jgi:hypothetical protein
MEATTWPVSPFWARSGGTENGWITRPRSLDADHAIQATPTAIASPTIAVITCSTARIRSLNRPQRRRDSTSWRCSCRCSFWMRISSDCSSRKLEALASRVLPSPPDPARPSARATAAALGESRLSEISDSDCSMLSAINSRA